MIPNRRCKVYRRREYQPDLQQGLRIVDRATPELVAENQPVWLTDYFTQAELNERGVVQDIAETERFGQLTTGGLVWTTPEWEPHEGDILVFEDDSQIEIRALAGTSIVTSQLPQHFKFSTTRIDI